MEIKKRIETCLTDLERKRQSIDSFQSKLRGLISSLKTEGVTPGTVKDLLKALESILKDYTEIGSNCTIMVEGLREVGEHLNRVEGGRRNILTGVEAILQNLSHLDRLSEGGLKVGTGTGKKPKRILLVRIQPGEKTPATLQEDDDEDGSSDNTVVH